MERRRRNNSRPPRERREEEKPEWIPKTALGREVKEGKIKSVEELLEKGEKIFEAEIIEALLPDLEVDYINVGQAKGKFGGGKRRIIRQTQKKTKQGSRLSFSTIAVVGNKQGYVGVAVGKAGESMPSKDKATRKAKINIMKVPQGCGSWECSCGEKHSLPFEISGECSSVTVKLMPAPKGTGLAVEGELKKILKLAGYKDVWSKVKGQSRRKQNLVAACVSALKKGSKMRLLNG